MTRARSDLGRRRLRFVSGGLAIALVLGFALPVLGARTQSNLVLIRDGDVIEEDLYAAGNNIQVDGVIEGDLIASAFDEISIGGRVDGSVVAVASRVVVTGEITGSLRVATPDLEISGSIGEDVFTAAWNVDVEREATIARDLLAWAWDARTVGSIGRNLEGQQRRLDLGGEVSGDAEITVNRLSVLPGADVGGDLVYTSDRAAEVDESATVGGSLVNERALPVNVRIRALGIMVAVLTTIAVVALGLSILWAGSERVERAAAAVRERPVVSFAWGVGILSVPLAVTVVLGLIVSLSPREAGIPLIGVFAPLILGLTTLLAFAALTTPVPVATAIGSLISSERTVYARFVLGFVVVWIAAVLPWVGMLVIAIVTALGLGAWTLSGPPAGVGEP